MIPFPAKIQFKEGSFVINRDTQIYAEKGLFDLQDYLLELIKPSTGFDLTKSKEEQTNNIIALEFDPSLEELNSEGYRLFVSKNSVQLSATKPEGIFYARYETWLNLPKAF